MSVTALSVSAQYLVGGSASALANGCYQLTPAVGNQAGYVYQNAAIDLNEPFDLKFTVYLGNNNGGADGIVFVLRGTLGAPYIGMAGGAIGYQGPGFSSNSLGIEVDTWFNNEYTDIAADHIGILKNGTVDHGSVNSLAGPIQASPNTPDVEDGNWHILNVRWDPVAEELEVYLDCDYRLLYAGDMINDVFNGDNLVHWGFLGTTGGAVNVQQFCLTQHIDSLVIDLADATMCAGDSVHLDAGDPLVVYDWSPAAGLSATNIHNPVATPNATATYYLEASHLCDTVLDTMTITVIQPDFNILSSTSDALCNGDCNGEIDIEVVNGSGLYDYLWSNSATNQDVAALCNGTYTVTVQDVDPNSPTYLCTLEEDYIIDEPTILDADILNPGKTSCPDGATCDASATADASGGTFPYYYTWKSGENTVVANQLCAGNNWLQVTDAHGCVDSAFISIDIPDSIETFAFGDTLICISNTTPIVGASTGGTPPFSYVWREANLYTGTVISTNTVTNVNPEVTTQYFVQSTDANGCAGDSAEVLVQVRPPLASAISDVDTICPSDTIEIMVNGFGGDTNYAYAWSSGSFSQIIAVSPNQSQWFIVTISDVCGTPPITDSVFVQVGGYKPIDARIQLQRDSLCVGEETYLIASGSGGFNGPKSYSYTWSHTSDRNNVQFASPQTTSSYSVTIEDECLSEVGMATATVHVGKPVIPHFAVMPDRACAESDVSIKLTNYNTQFSYDWHTGDGRLFEDYEVDSLLYKYTEPGCYDVSIDALSPFGCVATYTEPCAIHILQQPKAMFTTQPLQPSNIEPVLNFTNQSENAETFAWFFLSDTLVEVDQFQYQFFEFDTDSIVKLVVESADGCKDSISRSFRFQYVTLLYYPAAFTPNGDGKNEVFKIEGEAISAEGFELLIFDRWGRPLFETNDPAKGWNGNLADGQPAPQGAYPFILRYIDHLNQPRQIEDKVIISAGGTPTGLR